MISSLSPLVGDLGGCSSPPLEGRSGGAKILVFRLSAIGDIVLTTALLRNLRKTFPDAQIDFVVKKQFASLLDCVPYISNVYEFDSSQGLKGLFALRKTLAAQNYDVLLDIHKNWRSWFVTSTIHGKRYAYKKMVFKRSLLVKFKIDCYKPPRPVYLRFLDAAKALGVHYDGEKTSLVIPQAAQEFVENQLSSFRHYGLDPQSPKKRHEIAGQARNDGTPANPAEKYIVVCPGASFSNKQYPVELLTQVTQQLLQLNYSIVLLGGAKEVDLCEEILASTPLSHRSLSGVETTSQIINLAGKCNLTQSAAVVKNAQLTIANDTGMLHISEACGTPVVGLYGPTVEQFGYFPLLEQSKVAQVELACRPCTKMGMNYCPKGNFACLQTIAPETVVNYVQSIIQDRLLRSSQ